LTIDLDRREAVVFGRAVPLTPLEFAFLRVVVEAPGRTFSRDELLSRLHATDGRTPTDRSLDNLVVRLRRKLGDDPRRPRLIQAVWGMGYRLIAAAGPAGIELARQAIDLLPVPALLIDRDRTVLASNPAARRGLPHPPGGTACFDVLQCREGRHTLQDRCIGLEAIAGRIPVTRTRTYTITTRTGAQEVQAVYLPVTVSEQVLCLIVLAPASRPG
jgi:PAS domain-containing protein